MPLSETEHAALLAQVLRSGSIDPDLAGDFYRLSEGNPF